MDSDEEFNEMKANVKHNIKKLKDNLKSRSSSFKKSLEKDNLNVGKKLKKLK